MLYLLLSVWRSPKTMIAVWCYCTCRLWIKKIQCQFHSILLKLTHFHFAVSSTSSFSLWRRTLESADVPDSAALFILLAHVAFAWTRQTSNDGVFRDEYSVRRTSCIVGRSIILRYSKVFTGLVLYPSNSKHAKLCWFSKGICSHSASRSKFCNYQRRFSP